jgi:hypothetical protein
MTDDLRIPLRAADKDLVMRALDGRELAEWARPIILAEAQKLLDQNPKRSKKRAP